MKEVVVIANGFPNEDGTTPVYTFIKGHIDALAKYVKKVVVYVPLPYVPRWLRYIPYLNEKYERYLTFHDYSYDNVEVKYVKYFMLPFSYFRARNPHLAYKKIEKKVKKYSKDIKYIYAHFAWPSGVIAHKLAQVYNVPYFITTHKIDIIEFPYKGERYFDAISHALQGAQKIYTVAQRNIFFLGKLHCDMNKVKVINNGVTKQYRHGNKILSRGMLGLELNKKIILNVSFLRECKDHKFLFKVMKRLKGDAACYCIGDGEMKRELDEEIKRLGLKERVIMLGKLPHNKIATWMQAADLFLLTSDIEGNPTVLFESLATGLPFYSSDVGGVREILVSKKYGEVFDKSLGVRKIAEKVDGWLEEKKNRTEIAEYGKQFSWDAVVLEQLRELQ